MRGGVCKCKGHTFQDIYVKSNHPPSFLGVNTIPPLLVIITMMCNNWSVTNVPPLGLIFRNNTPTKSPLISKGGGGGRDLILIGA